MRGPTPAPMPLKHRLFLAATKRDGTPIALVEAQSDDHAASRAAYVVMLLGLGEPQDVVIRPAARSMCSVPTFLDGFFPPEPTRPLLH